MGRCNVPTLPNLQALLAAGINPKTGLPYKIDANSGQLKADIKMFLRLIDEQDAVNRYVWYNLPANISSQELERMLYYRGQVCFFYYEPLDSFYFMPYTLDGSLDFYGRFNRIHPVPMYAGGEEINQKTAQEKLLETIKLNVVHSVMLEEPDEEMMSNSTVLLWDYSKQMGETIIPRTRVNDGLLDVMADCIPFMNTALLHATGIKGMRVQDQDQYMNVYEANKSFKDAALKQQQYIPVIGSIEFQDLADGSVANAEEFMLAMQSLDNLRLSGYGIDNGGLFEKKARELNAEAAINGGPVGLVLQDGLSIRQNFCNIVNSIWDLGIWCEPAESITQMDVNGDGAIYDRNENGQSSGVDNQPQEGGSEE